MSAIDAVLPATFNPLDDALNITGEEAKGAQDENDAVHVRVQQRNGKKSITSVQGLKQSYDYKKVLKALKKEFCCNGTVVEDSELGQVIQLQGDQRKNVQDFLLKEKLVKKDQLKIHGF